VSDIVNAKTVLDFWFGDDPYLWRRDPWFTGKPAFDAILRERFADTAQAALQGSLDSWAQNVRGALALVLVLDQIPRNIHRGTRRAFAGDPRARRVARAALANGAESTLTPVQCAFLYMPFMHSEDAADQDLSVQLFETLRADPQMEECATYAHRHRDVIARFGRFPQRNEAMARKSTKDEIAFLADKKNLF
jgi:uncharacterized protein (DUF924 family)